MTRRVKTIIIVTIVSGALCYFEIMLAFGLAGAGHGWIAPLFFAPVVIFSIPYSLIRSYISNKSAAPNINDLAFIIFFIPVNVLLIYFSFQEASNFFQVLDNDFMFVIIWILIWVFPQALVSILLYDQYRCQQEGLDSDL